MFSGEVDDEAPKLGGESQRWAESGLSRKFGYIVCGFEASTISRIL